MGLSPVNFCGLSVIGMSGDLGWNEQQGHISVTLVQDVGDTVAPVPVGFPTVFQLGSFTFAGILQDFKSDTSLAGKVYTAMVVDPREILRNCTIILDGYPAASGLVPNLVNVYGYYESRLGYGASGVTDAGMQWNKVLIALNAIINTNANGPYGGPLNYKGVKYSVDLSEVPVPPSYYRIGGVSITLFDAISQLCRDGGVDFFIDLVGYTIRVRTVSKSQTMTEGSLVNWIESLATSGYAVQTSVGKADVAGETSSIFLVGGEVTTLYQTTTIHSFWGYGIDGKPILGDPGYTFWIPEEIPGPALIANIVHGVPSLTKTPTPIVSKTKPAAVAGYQWVAGQEGVEKITLNSSIVQDITADPWYRTNTVELQFALDSIDSWLDYLRSMNPAMYTLVTGDPAVVKEVPEKPNNANLLQNSVFRAVADVKRAIGDLAEVRKSKVYALIRGYAEEFYGRKWLVSLPWIGTAIDTDTLRVKAAADPVSTGYWPEASYPLGISPLNETIFSDAQGKYYPIVKYEAVGADLTAASPESSVIESNFLYTKASVADDTVKTSTVPGALITTPVIADDTKGAMGAFEMAAAVLQLRPRQLKSAIVTLSSFTRLAPPRRKPSAAAVPLRSNIDHYGPWTASSGPGRVEYRQDSSLVPWNFGGVAAMNLAAMAEVSNGITSLQNSESGQVEVGALPAFSLGDAIESGGPNLTNINVTYNAKSGYTTIYSFRTFTPRFGVISKQLADRIRNNNLAAHDVRRVLRATTRERLRNAGLAGKKPLNLDKAMPKQNRRNTPHDAMVFHTAGSGVGYATQYGAVTSALEAVPMLQGDDASEYWRTGSVSMDGMFRPFLNSWECEHPTMGTLCHPNGSITFPGLSVPTSLSYNYFADGCDVGLVAHGSGYIGYSNETVTDWTLARPMALRGPAFLTGYGVGIDGKCYPPASGNPYAYHEDRRSRPDLHKAGPIDHVWDKYRGVWTSHDLFLAYSPSGIPARGSGMVNLKAWNPDSDTETVLGDAKVYNWYGGSIGSGLRLQVGYFPHVNRLLVVGVDCDD